MISDDTVAGVACARHEQVHERWLALLRTHVLGSHQEVSGSQLPHALLPDARSFHARVRAGRLGPLRFCHLDMTPHIVVTGEATHTCFDDHAIVLQLAGISTFGDGRRSVRLRPGSILLIGNTTSLRVEHETRVKQIVLQRPLAQQAGTRPSHPLTLCEANAGNERMVFRWVTDACLNENIDGCESVDAIAHTLVRLLAHVLRGASDSQRLAVPRGLTCERVKDFITQNLGDPSLTAASIAKTFGCSVRTLHRAFRSSGEDSLSRQLWRMRIEACAAELRSWQAAALSLTDLAMRWGFASSAHFSSLFREICGTSPSEYRRWHREDRADFCDLRESEPVKRSLHKLATVI